jgi:hypothetical protein
VVESVATECAVELLAVEARETERVGDSSLFLPDWEDSAERVECPLAVLVTGGRVRGRESVAGTWCVRGRRGVCGARGLAEVEIGADVVAGTGDLETDGFEGVGRLTMGAPVMASTSSSWR